MYLRIADYTGETLPEKFTILTDRFNASKAEFLFPWKKVSYYVAHPDAFEVHYSGCSYEAE
jgi:hypothetical protein